MVRRLKSELPPEWDGTPRFPKRELVPLEIDYDEQEREVHRMLRRYTKSLTKHVSDECNRFVIEFVLKLLKKRLFSSPEAFRSTLEKHVASLRRRGPAKSLSLRSVQREIDRMEDDYDDDDQYEEIQKETIGTATQHFRALTEEEESLLEKMRNWAQNAVHKPDSKTRQMLKWLKGVVKPDGRWSDERVIIFTEYRATQKWLMERFATEGLTGGGRVGLLYGGMTVEDREKIKNAFQASPGKSPIRILLATDSASEGIDLQNHCHRIVHFEIPWNPNRLEQRNGRVDRHGQLSKEVLIYHFVAKGYQEQVQRHPDSADSLEADLEFLKKVVDKVDQIREDLGKVGPVIAQQIEDAMLGRRYELDTADAEKQARKAGAILRTERKIREEIQRFHDQLKETRNDLRLSPENIKSVVDIGLDLAGKPPLRETTLDGIWPDPTGRRKECPVFHVPPLGTDSWRYCAEGLADPFETKTIRPIVFDGNLVKHRHDVVLCHLNHRLVQMCLRLLRAEVWSGQHLNRVTARLLPDGIVDTPAVIAHARLVITSGFTRS